MATAIIYKIERVRRVVVFIRESFLIEDERLLFEDEIPKDDITVF
ncbi:MAG: hypothetical protein WCD88_04050 [Desulfobacterales bacterium]